MQPGRERGAPLEAAEISPHLDRRVLHGVFGLVGVAQNAHGQRQQLRPGLGQQPLQRLAFTCLRGCDQLTQVGRGGGACESAPAGWGVFAWRGRLVWRVGGIVKPPTRGHCNRKAGLLWRRPRVKFAPVRLRHGSECATNTPPRPRPPPRPSSRRRADSAAARPRPDETERVRAEAPFELRTADRFRADASIALNGRRRARGRGNTRRAAAPARDGAGRAARGQHGRDPRLPGDRAPASDVAGRAADRRLRRRAAGRGAAAARADRGLDGTGRVLAGRDGGRARRPVRWWRWWPASGVRRARCATIAPPPATRASCCRRWRAICCRRSSWRPRTHPIRARPPCPRASYWRSRTTSRAASAPWTRGSWCRCGPPRARSPPGWRRSPP